MNGLWYYELSWLFQQLLGTNSWDLTAEETPVCFTVTEKMHHQDLTERMNLIYFVTFEDIKPLKKALDSADKYITVHSFIH